MTIAVHSTIIKAVEAELIAAAPADFMMQQAAQHLADFISALLAKHPATATSQVLVAAGGGGNGGDGLYAAALLAAAGKNTAAVLWHPAGKVHEAAYAAALQAGCHVYSRAEIAELHTRLFPVTAATTDTDKQPSQQPAAEPPRLILVDAIQGLGSTPLHEADAKLWQSLAQRADTIVAVDIPTGVAVDTGTTQPPFAAAPTGAAIARHVTADYTVTFGPLRLAHALSDACGTVFHADIHGAAGESLYELTSAAAFAAHATGSTWRPGTHPVNAAANPVTPAVIECHLAWQHTSRQLLRAAPALQPWDKVSLPDLTPRPKDHKYRRGVPALVAGSDKYPGAAVLVTQAAVNSGAGMVRYAGTCGAAVIAHCPEVVLESDICAITKTDCFVFGPGVGTGRGAAATLRWLIHTTQPLIIDADGLTLLAGSSELQQQLRERTAPTLLTPHWGEFERLTGAPPSAPAAATVALAQRLRATVLLKGRKTLIATPQGTLTAVDAGNSWAATAGSGDVLAGILATNCARTSNPAAPHWIVAAVATHAVAAQLAATTTYGTAPTSATKIAVAIPAAQALLQQPQLQQDALLSHQVNTAGWY